MSLDAWLAFSLFAFVTAITPGPNNLMLLASGVNFGLRGSLRHWLGICIGFFVMLAAVGFGIGQIFARFPDGYTLLRWLGAAYLLYLAWDLARAEAPTDEPGTAVGGKPLGFWGAAAFQWVNPKAWVMAVGAYSAYVPAAGDALLVLAVAALFALITAPSIGVWAVFGAGLRRWLAKPAIRRRFNRAMAALLVVSLIPMLAAG